MNKTLVVCGDSFNYGIGCIDLYTQPYGVLVANHFNWNLVRLARGSASNYTTYLQGLYAADMSEKPYLVILGQTSYDRIEWFTENKPKHFHTHSLVNLNYHMYPPHFDPQPHHDAPMEYYLQKNPEYKPCMLSEQVGGIDDCLKMRKINPDFPYYSRLATESSRKLELIRDYYLEIFDHSIKRNYDIGMLLQAYIYIKRKGINCIVLTSDIDYFEKFIESKDLLYQDWYSLTKRFPDTIESGHTSEQGHRDTADRVIAKLNEIKLV